MNYYPIFSSTISNSTRQCFVLNRNWIFCGKILNDLGIHIIVVGQIDLWSFHDVTFSMPEFVLMGGKDIEFILIITVVFRIKKKNSSLYCTHLKKSLKLY